MKHYLFIDYATQGYILAVGLLVLLFHNNRVPSWGWIVAAHGAVLVLVHLLIRLHGRRRPGGFLDFLRHFYPVLLYTGFYRETGLLNQMFMDGYLDPVFIRAEEAIFGFQPSLLFMELLPHLWVSEVFYASYFSYYVMIVGVGLALFLRDRRQFFHYVSLVSFVFYVCYFIYICLPVTGPRLFYRELGGYRLPAEVVAAAPAPAYPAVVEAGPFFQLMAWIYANFESPGAAFPSSHVAVAICTVYFSWRYLPRIRVLHAVVAGLLCLSTIYCRYHYAVDTAAGVLTAMVLMAIGQRLYARLDGPRRRP